MSRQIFLPPSSSPALAGIPITESLASASGYMLNDSAPVALPLSHYLWLLRRAWWKILLAVVLCTGLAALVAMKITPVYEATARIVVDPQVSTSLMGERTPVQLEGSEADTFFNTELQMIQSDAVLRPVAAQYGLLLKAAKQVPAGMDAADAPVKLSGLTVVHPANSFLIDISYRSHNPRLAADVANAITRSFSLHSHAMRSDASREEFGFITSQMTDLKQKMDDSARALATYEKQLGVIDPDEKSSILENRLKELNTDLTQAQSDRMQKESEMHSLQAGSSAALEVSQQGTELAKLASDVRVEQEKMEAVKQVYGTANAEYRHAASALAEAQRQYALGQTGVGKRIETQFDEAKHRESLIAIALQETKGQFDALNSKAVQYQELKRDAEANKALYAELFRKVQESRLNAAFQGSPIRVADQARPQLGPVFPNKKIFIGLGFLLSLCGSLVVVLVADMMDKSLRDPQQARRDIGVHVIGTLPQVQETNFSPLSLPEHESRMVVAKNNNWFRSREFYEEAVGALLATIRVNRLDRQIRSIVVTSPTQGEGKSTCIAHLAAAHARQGHRTLLIDADLRCPTQHRHFKVDGQVGLANAVYKRMSLVELAQNVPGNLPLDVIAAGEGDIRSTERVGKVVEELLRHASETYDMVFIDSPPMMCFAEPIQLAAAADGVLLVCHAGETSKAEVLGALNTLAHIGKVPLGLVLNRMRQKMSAQYGAYQQAFSRRMQPAA